MTLRVLGAVAACSLVFLAYTPVAHADTITFSGVAAESPVGTAIPDRASWKMDNFTGWFFVTATNGQLVGNWDFGTVNPFMRDMAHSGDDIRLGLVQLGLSQARQFLSSPMATSNSAAMQFAFANAGDRDADTMGDFHVTRTSAAFTKFGSTGQPVPTPEPASLVLLGSGLAGLVAYKVRRRK